MSASTNATFLSIRSFRIWSGVAKYDILIKPSATKEIESLGTKQDRQRIVARIRVLSSDPRPPGCEKLAGQTDRYRVRQGRYRIVYSVDDAEDIVTVFRVGHRKEVYRWARPELLKDIKLSLQDINDILDIVAACSEQTDLHFSWRPQLPDPKDEMVLETALNSRAEALVTFNRTDFAVACANLGVDLLSPSQFLERLRKRS
jgi:mRNA interferase RelE/StbE